MKYRRLGLFRWSSRANSVRLAGVICTLAGICKPGRWSSNRRQFLHEEMSLSPRAWDLLSGWGNKRAGYRRSHIHETCAMASGKPWATVVFLQTINNGQARKLRVGVGAITLGRALL